MKLKKILTILIVLLPILSLYSLPNSKVLIFDVIIAALYPIMFYDMLKRNEKIRRIFYWPLCLPLLYIIIQCVILLGLSSYDSNSILFRSLHNVFYMFTVIFFIKQYFDIEFGLKVLCFTAVISTIYIIVQYVLINAIGYYLPGTLPFFKTVVDEFNKTIMESGLKIRPRAFFSEPSAYSCFIALFLIIDLFSGRKRKFTDYILDILVSVGLLLARSTTGYLLGFIIWGLWGFKTFKKSIKNKPWFLLLSMILIPLILYFIVQTESFSIFINHTFGTGDEVWGTGVINRIENYVYAFSTNGLSSFEILFGRGMQMPDYYIPGIPRLFYYFGFIGILLWIYTYLYIFLDSNCDQKRVLALMIVIAFFGDSLFGINYLIYFPFIITLKNSNKNIITSQQNDIIEKVE